jgi:hypothetical protein
MGILMIRCSKTGRAISTGTYVEAASFRSSPVFFGQTYCSHCNAIHEWFAKDAWVCDSETSDQAEHERRHLGLSA